MSGNDPLTVQWGFGLLTSFILAAFWYYMRALSDKFKTAEQDRAEIRKELMQIKLDYRTKAEARADNENVMAALSRMEAKMDKLNDKMDRKADKS